MIYIKIYRNVNKKFVGRGRRGDSSGKFYDFVPWSLFYANPQLIKTYVLPFAFALTQPSCYFPLHEI